MDRDARILKLYGEGMQIKRIAVEVGMAANSVGVVLKRLGVDRPAKPQKKVREYDADMVLVLWDQGLSTSAIAERLQVGRETVARVLKSCGRDLASVRRVRYDGEGGTVARGGNAFARIARKT